MAESVAPAISLAKQKAATRSKRDGFLGLKGAFFETPVLGFTECSRPLAEQACSFQAGRSLFGFARPALSAAP